jgi:hypothetical protein
MGRGLVVKVGVVGVVMVVQVGTHSPELLILVALPVLVKVLVFDLSVVERVEYVVG